MLLSGPLVVADDEQRDVPLCSVLMRDSALQENLDPEERDFLDLFLVNQKAEYWERFRGEMLVSFEGSDEAFKAKIRRDVEPYAFSFAVEGGYHVRP